MPFLRRATAATVVVGPMISSADCVTPRTNLSLSVRLSRDGGPLAARSSASPPPHDADGYYRVALGESDTSAAGRLRLSATGAGALPALEDFTVLDGAVFDVLFGSSAPSTLTAAAVDALLEGRSSVPPPIAPAVPPPPRRFVVRPRRLTPFLVDVTFPARADGTFDVVVKAEEV